MTKTPDHDGQREHGSHIITVLERTWAVIRSHHPDVPRVVMITGRGADARGITLGHFHGDLWTAHATRTPELFVSGELLGLGGQRVVETLLHEATHAVAHVRGIQDTSNGDRYHNKRFVTLAAELGLTRPDEPHKTRGYSACTITAETVDRYRQEIEALDAEALPYLDTTTYATPGIIVTIPGLPGAESPTATTADPEPGSQEEDQPRDGARFPIECGCQPPRRTQVTPAFFEAAPITCGACGQEFGRAAVKPRQPQPVSPR